MREEIELYSIIIGFIAVIIFAATRSNIDTTSLLIGITLIGLPLRLLILYKNETFANRIAWVTYIQKGKYEQGEREKADDFTGMKVSTYPMENEDFLIPERAGVWLSKKHGIYLYWSDVGLFYSKDSINFCGKATPPSEPFNLKKYLSSDRITAKLNREGWFKKQIEEGKEFNKKYGEKDE